MVLGRRHSGKTKTYVPDARNAPTRPRLLFQRGLAAAAAAPFDFSNPSHTFKLTPVGWQWMSVEWCKRPIQTGCCT
jgi:hypothetical protein